MAEAQSWEAGSTERISFHNLRGSFWVSYIAEEKQSFLDSALSLVSLLTYFFIKDYFVIIIVQKMSFNH